MRRIIFWTVCSLALRRIKTLLFDSQCTNASVGSAKEPRQASLHITDTGQGVGSFLGLLEQ